MAVPACACGCAPGGGRGVDDDVWLDDAVNNVNVTPFHPLRPRGPAAPISWRLAQPPLPFAVDDTSSTVFIQPFTMFIFRSIIVNLLEIFL